MLDETSSQNLGNALICSDYAEVRFLAGPWDSGVLTLGKEFNAPDRLYCRPLVAMTPEGYIHYYVHSGFLTDNPERTFARYNFLLATDPERDENQNMRVRYYYLFHLCKSWRATKL